MSLVCFLLFLHVLPFCGFAFDIQGHSQKMAKDSVRAQGRIIDPPHSEPGKGKVQEDIHGQGDDEGVD